jgi:hypothetical protein
MRCITPGLEAGHKERERAGRKGGEQKREEERRREKKREEESGKKARLERRCTLKLNIAVKKNLTDEPPG